MRQISSIAGPAGASPSAFTFLVRLWRSLLLLASIASFLPPRITAAGDDPFGFYVGGALGHATLRTGNIPFLQELLGTTPAAISEHDTGWKAVMGVRPLSMVGAELEYIDFGRGNGTIPSTFQIGNVQGDLRAHAGALFGVGYLPLPLPLLDVYAK